MYTINERHLWRGSMTNTARHIGKALELLQGQRATEDEVRFALDVVAPDLRMDPWQAFRACLGELVMNKTIKMDRNEIRSMKREAVLAMQQAMQPMIEVASAEIMDTVDDVSRQWDLPDLAHTVHKATRRAVMTSLTTKAKDPELCECLCSRRRHRDRNNNDGRMSCSNTECGCTDFRALSK
jgi:hypothetical protein